MLVEHYENPRHRRIHDRADVAVASPLVKHLYTPGECMEQGFSEVRTTKQRSSHPKDSPYRGCAWDPALARVSVPGGSGTPQGLLRLAPCLVHRPIAYSAAPGGVGLSEGGNKRHGKAVHKKLIEPGAWVSVRDLAGSEASQQASQRYVGTRGRVIEQAMDPEGDYIVEMEDGTHQRLPAAALTRILTDADGEPL